MDFSWMAWTLPTALFFIGTLLFAITFVSNTAGQWIIKRMQRRMQGAGA